MICVHESFAKADSGCANAAEAVESGTQEKMKEFLEQRAETTRRRRVRGAHAPRVLVNFDDVMKKQLSSKQREDLLAILQARFEKNMPCHEGLAWARVKARSGARAAANASSA